MVSRTHHDNLSSFQSRVITTKVTIFEMFAAGEHGMNFFDEKWLKANLK